MNNLDYPKTNAELGRAVMRAYVEVRGVADLITGVHYVNKGKKYVSIKIDEPHLTPDQMTKFIEMCQVNPRFIKAYNSYSIKRTPYHPSTYKADKVNVRFTLS